MGKMFKKCIPLLMAVTILFGTVFCDYEKVSATGVSDILYYTYFDLINTIYATCGYDMDVSEAEINNHGVTGKQVWDNFCTAVEGTAKFHGKLFKGAMTELYGLAKNATQKGISMSQNLYDMLKDALATHAEECSTAYTGVISSFDSARDIIAGICGTSPSAVPRYGNFSNAYLYIYKYANDIYIFTDVRNNIVSFENGHYLNDLGQKIGSNYGIRFSSGKYRSDVLCPASPDCVWLVCHSYIFSDKSITARVAQGACPQEVPETIPWHKEKSIPDEWRIVQPDEHPDKDPEEQPDVLPAVIPFPNAPETPGTSETEESSETPGKDPDKNPDKNPDSSPDNDKDKNTAPDILINPSTGNYIDPNTGFDIDPKTGYLIDPESGKLIDPKNLPDSGGGSGDLPGAVSGYGDITKLFPFCIPFDIVRLIKGMQAEQAPPVFHYEHRFDSIDYTFVVDVDLSDYAKYIKIFRFGMQIFYVLALMFLTLKVSKIFI